METFKNRKTSGKDEINLELIKYASDRVKTRMCDIFNICWYTLKIPQDWNTAIVKPIFKKGNRKDLNNYRGICLLNTSYKLFSKIITRRLNKITEVLLKENQYGFRNGRSCADCVFIMKQLIQKRREFNLETHLLFVDYIKAFDNVLRGKLWTIMTEKGYPKHLIDMIKIMYKDTAIAIDNGNSTNFKIEKINLGVRQGCPLSPTLFNIYLDAAVIEWQTQLSKHFKLGTTIVDTIMFADDQVICAESENQLQIATLLLKKTMENYNLKISTKKKN